MIFILIALLSIVAAGGAYVFSRPKFTPTPAPAPQIVREPTEEERKAAILARISRVGILQCDPTNLRLR